MLIALAYCNKDQDQAEHLVGWIVELGGCKGHELLLGQDSSVTNAEIVTELFRQSFDKVSVLPIKNPFNEWPHAPNHCYSEIARHIENNNLAQYFLWIESDVVPLRAGWLDTLETEYKSCGKPFMGELVEVNNVIPHMSGIAIYAGQMTKHAGLALIANEEAWDCAAAEQILPKLHKTKLIHHSWQHPQFESWEQVERDIFAVKPEAVLFHADKTSSLIDLLRAKKNYSECTRMLPDTQRRQVADENAPHQAARSDALASKETGGKSIVCDILIKSYPKDFEWLSYCLGAINKFASGFREVIIVLPQAEVTKENPIYPPIGTLVPFSNQKIIYVVENGDPYLFQQAVKANAHEFTDVDYILHIDSDVILTQPITPESFFHEGKPIWYMTPYEKTDTPWRPFTEKFLGEPVEYEFMRRFPICVPRKLHLAVSAFCMAHHKMRLTDYILSQPNREYSEFNCLGALAYSRAREDFHWIDTTKEELPEPFGKQFWSYGGITPEIRVELEKILEELVYDNIVTNPRNVSGSSNQHSNDTTLHSAIRLANQMVPSGTQIRQTKEGIWVLTNDTHISKWVEEKGVLQHDFQTLPVVLPEIPVGGVVIDIGANIGDSTAPFLERVGPAGTVYAFEPNSDAYECLRRNCPKANCVQVAIGDTEIESHLAIEVNAGASHLTEESGCAVSVEVQRLDYFKITRCDFIKIDVEGYELHVLKGAEQTIAKFRPKMLIEINEEALRRQGTTQAEVLNWLSAHGYQWWPVNQPNLKQALPQFDILCKYKGGDALCALQEAKAKSGTTTDADATGHCNATPKSNPEGVAAAWDSGKDILIPPITPWRDKKESIAEIDRLACELKQFCTAPRSTLIVRERLRKIRVITKIR